jgi:hypothetical protein
MESTCRITVAHPDKIADAVRIERLLLEDGIPTRFASATSAEYSKHHAAKAASELPHIL